MDAVDISEQIVEKWMIIQWSLAIGILVLIFFWKEGLLKINHWMPKVLIRGQEVFLAFFLFLFFELILVPQIALGGILFYDWYYSQTSHLSTILYAWLNFFVILGGFSGVVLMIFKINPDRRKKIFQQTTTPWFKNFLFGAVLWGLVYPFLIAFSEGIHLFLLYFFQYSAVDQIAVAHIKQLMSYPLLFGLTGLEIVTLVPFTEEVLFRGFLQNWLKNKWNRPILSVVCTAAVFSLFHFSVKQGLSNIELLCSLFLMGCVLGWVYEKQRSLWASIGLHSFFNFMSILFLFMSEKIENANI